MLFAIAICSPALGGQDPDKQGSSTIQGTVCDAQNRPLANATVLLEPKNKTQKLVSHTDSDGH